MYLDRPKSPSFTQSVEDTNTFLAAMSLWTNTHVKPDVTHTHVCRCVVILTCVRSVCSPGTPALCSAGKRTESMWTDPGCTFWLVRTTSTVKTQLHQSGEELKEKPANQKKTWAGWVKSYLSECTQLHNDPDGIFCDYSDQLHDVWMIKLPHCHC